MFGCIEKKFHSTLFLLSIFLFAGCTGLTLGENNPGDDTYLEGGAIAVDPQTENVYVLKRTSVWDEELAVEKDGRTLFRAHPDQSEATPVFSRSGHADLRMIFPGNSLLMMEQISEDEEKLSLLDPQSFATLKEVTKPAQYYGTRLSPSGRYLVVADNNADEGSPLHLIDTQTLEHVVIPHDGDWLEAMWLNNRDILVAAVFYEQYEPSARVRILAWSFQVDSPFESTTAGGNLWVDPIMDITKEGVSMDWSMSFTWIGISPDDTQLVLPVLERADATGRLEYTLIFADLETGELRTHADARGPVGFTPDGSTVVSYRTVKGQGSGDHVKVVLIDRATHEEQILDLPYESGPQYFVTREGHFLVIAPNFGSQGNLMVYDFDTEKMETVAGPSVNITEFVSRLGENELWLVDDGLYRFDFLEQQLDAVALDWVPENINILPDRDTLVLDDSLSNRILFFDPVDEKVLREVLLSTEGQPVL